MASKRNQHRKSCEKKYRYSSETEANTARLALIHKGERRMNVYHCQFCSGWHVGHMPHRQFIGMIAKNTYGEK